MSANSDTAPVEIKLREKYLHYSLKSQRSKHNGQSSKGRKKIGWAKHEARFGPASGHRDSRVMLMGASGKCRMVKP